MESRHIISVALAAAVIVLVSGTLGSLVSCNTFRPVWIKELPPECNMALNAFKMYYDSKDKSGSVIPVERCYACLKKLRCQAMVYGADSNGRPRPITYRSADAEMQKKYESYKECLADWM